MKDSYEQRVQNQFGGFCTRVLKNEAARIRYGKLVITSIMESK